MSATAFLSEHPDAGEQRAPRGPVGQHLPVHRLREHHQRRPAGRRAHPRVPSEVTTMTAIAAERYTGASIKRSEDPRILTGSGRYVDDIKLPGMLHAAFVRSPMAARPHPVRRRRGGPRAARRGGRADRRRPGGADRRRAGPAAGPVQPGRSHPGVHPAGHGQGAPGRRSGGGRDRREPVPGRGRLRAGGGRLRRPAPGGERRLRAGPEQPAAVRQPGRQHRPPALAERVRRRVRDLRRGRPGGRGPHRRAPAPERAHGRPRLRGQLGRQHRGS